jgi:ABC-type multidrug transport system permease subunit
MEALVRELGTAEAATAPDAGEPYANEPDSTEELADGDGDPGGRFDVAAALTEVLGLAVEDVVGGSDAAVAQQRAQQAHAISGVAVMMLLFGLVACGATLLQEKDEGTLERLQLAPGAARAILGGKFLFTWIVGLMQLVILFLYARLIFDVPIFRAPLALAVHSAAVAAAATGFGVLFAVVCRTHAQLEGLSTIVILTMSAAGGSWWPLAITPGWYQFLGHFTLNAWAMDGYQAIFWYGKGLGGIARELAVLAGIALATSLAAVYLWNRRVRV